jgi:hypothetical protein
MWVLKLRTGRRGRRTFREALSNNQLCGGKIFSRHGFEEGKGEGQRR